MKNAITICAAALFAAILIAAAEPTAADAEKPAATTADAEKTASADGAAKPENAKGKDKAKNKKPSRDAIITADRTDYDRKEGVILFDRNVHLDDEQYQMHADRLFVFLDGTNDLKRLVAIGHVAITNEDKRAYCAKATYAKQTGKIVMYSDETTKAKLREESKKGSTVVGEKITFWLNSEQVEVDGPVITLPGAALQGGDAKKMLLGK